MAEANTVETEQTTQEEVTYTPEQTQEYIKTLRDENKTNRIKAQTLEDQAKQGAEALARLKEIEESKLKDEGKINELLENTKKELEALKGVDQENEQYKSMFQKDLEAEVADLPENLQMIVNNSGDSLVNKLETARTLKAELGIKKTNSPAPERGGVFANTESEDKMIQQFRDEKNITKKQSMLMEIKKIPQVYKKLLQG